MLESIIRDVAYISGSVLADNLSTYFAAKKVGTSREQSVSTKEGMEKYGVGKYLLKTTKPALKHVLVRTGVLYCLDLVFGISDQMLNLHNLYVYGFGSVKYIATLSNTFIACGRDDLAAKISFIPKTFMRVCNLTGKKYDLGEEK